MEAGVFDGGSRPSAGPRGMESNPDSGVEALRGRTSILGTLTSLAALTLLCAASALAAPAATAAVSRFGGGGSAAGKFVEPHGIAVDQESREVYVVDRNNQRVEKFGPEGAFLLAWGWGVADGETKAPQTCSVVCHAGVGGSGAGQFDFPEGVAVDNSSNPLDLSHGDVYVVDIRDYRVEKFDSSGNFLLMFGGDVNRTKVETAGATEAERDLCTAASGDECQAGVEGTSNGQFEGLEGDLVAVGPDGTVYVGDLNRVQEFSPEGAYESQVTLAGAGRTTALTVDQSGDLYVLSSELAGVRKYDGAGAELDKPRDASGAPETVAVGPSGELFVDDEIGEQHHVFEYDASGSQLASFDFAPERYGRGMAFGEGVGVLYVLGRASVRLVAPPSPGPIALAGSESASPVQPTTATLHATINTENKATTYHFEYGTSTAYGTSIPVPDGELPASFEDVPVGAELSGLSVNTVYHYRVVATNAAGTFTGPDETFTTLPPALIDGEWATNVASKSANLEARINPLGADTTYRFEYGTSAAYGASSPIPDGDAGPGTSDVTVGVHLQELEPRTTYHYRLVTHNVLGTVMGEDQTFTTQQAKGGTAALPDGRAWEMVSPVDKQGAALEPIGFEQGEVIQASAAGNAIAYTATAATEAEPQGNRNLEATQVLSARAPSGWVSKDIDTPNSGSVVRLAIGEGPEYRLFSSDLSLAFLEPRTPTPLPPLPESAEGTIYLRHSQTGEYEPLVTAANVVQGAKFGYGYGQGSYTNLTFMGASTDLAHVVFKSFAALTKNALGSPQDPNLQSLYEWSGGQLQLVSLLPNDKPANEEELRPELGFQSGIVRHAISDDGSRVVWATRFHIYLRDTVSEETVQVDAAQGVEEAVEAHDVFQTASSDGSKVFFTSPVRLTADSTASGSKADLYEFELTAGKPLAGKLVDLTVAADAESSADVITVIGASEDGASIYFEARGLLGDAGERGVVGSPNVYVERYDRGTKDWSSPHLIASLLPQDITREVTLEFKPALQFMTARVSPNGKYLTFMSARSLTGYDNRDAISGVPDEEVFIYDGGAGRLSCASCDSTGSRPNGALDKAGYPGLLVDRAQRWPTRWLAALVPGWTAIDLSHSIYQSRYLSNSGRLFFDSHEALVPQDTNGTWDVYEYEPPGVGGCAPSDTTFNLATNGCVGLISSGGSAEESAFLDASETGDDAFFLTAAGLVSRDGDTLLDVYDARVCSAASPCLAVPPVSPPACSTGDSCKPAVSPQPEGFGAPASQTFSGAGNLALAGPRAVAPSKSATRAQKLAKALRACRKKPKRKRAACERQARKYYGSKRRAVKSTANTSLPSRVGR